MRKLCNLDKCCVLFAKHREEKGFHRVVDVGIVQLPAGSESVERKHVGKY